MATGGSRFDDKKYINWLRATLALIDMKEGLEEFTINQSELFHDKLIQSLGSTPQPCKGRCSSNDIKKDFSNKRWHMTCSVCNIWLQNIVSSHIAPFPNLSTKNTDPGKWHTAHWETAKLFMPYGCGKHQSAKDADIQGILNLFLNCTHFINGTHIGKKNLLEKLLDIRNSLMHSGTFQVSDTDVQDHLQTVLLFLHGMSGLKGSERDNVQEAIERVNQLQANLIEISINKELELRALQQRQVALDSDLRSQVHVVVGLLERQDEQSIEVKQQREILKELKAAKQRFDEFLEHNDIDKISKRITYIDERVNVIEKKLSTRADRGSESVREFEAECRELQHQLIRNYRKRKFWENPLTSEEVYLTQMYAKPSVRHNWEKNSHGELAEIDKQTGQHFSLTYKRIFTCETELCENIYISGDAGVGKTILCNQLALNWCNAVQNIHNEAVSSDDMNVLASFRFLFWINLRETENNYHVEDMIQEQLLSNVHLSLNISDILKNEKCLIVLDGLDEWTCPGDVKKCPDINKGIPGRNTSYENCVYLTTTRKWKYDVIALKHIDVDKHIELGGIDKKSIEELANKMVSYLERKSQTRKNIYDFYKDVSEKRLTSFLTMPVLLIQLITLWYFGKDFGNSQLQLYCNMLGLLFERSDKNLLIDPSKCSGAILAQPQPCKLPACFSLNSSCQKHAKLLYCLAELAYKALFNKQKEEALVFKSSIMDILGISPSDIQLCLECGIVSQSKDYGNNTGKYKKFTFLHKKVQEFLAALFIVSNNNAEGILEEVKQFCNSLEVMLEMNQVWLFIAGMDRDMTTLLFEHLAHVVSADERVKKYRHALDSDRFEDRLKEDIQEIVSDCVSEGINNDQQYVEVCMEDFHIIDYTVRGVESLLLCTDMSKVKSVFVRPGGTMDAKWADITDQFQQCHSLQKVYLDELLLPLSFEPCSVARIVDNNSGSLTSLDLLTKIQATDKLVDAICSSISKSLMALRMYGVKLTHRQTKEILDNLSQSKCIKQLELELFCKGNVKQIRTSLDWSSMNRLREVTLSGMHIDNLHSLPYCVEMLVLRWARIPMIILREFARELSQTRRFMTVKLNRVILTEARAEWGPLDAFLCRCSGVNVTECQYNERSDMWEIAFHTNSQEIL